MREIFDLNIPRKRCTDRWYIDDYTDDVYIIYIHVIQSVLEVHIPVSMPHRSRSVHTFVQALRTCIPSSLVWVGSVFVVSV